MKNKEFRKLLKKNKSNAGFTLTELLVGLVMSVFVIGALGFGLMQVLRSSQTESTKIAARNETSRALEFISDELRRAQSIEVDMTSGNISTVAPNYTVPTGGTVRLALEIPGTSERVIYSVAPPKSGSPWKGPLVIYRWGPELDANGNYSTTGAGRVDNPTGWTNEALVDKVDDTDQIQACGGSSTTYQGFFACVVDDDGDTDAAGNPIVENATDTDGDGDIDADDTTDLNGDGKIDAGDGADVDGKSITAQLFFAGEVLDSSYFADTQAVARARTAPDSNSEDLDSYTMSLKSLNPQYGREIGPNRPCWKVRNDFGEGINPSFDPNEASPNPNALSNIFTWIHEENRQPQPLKTDTTKPFTMVASAFAAENPKGSNFGDTCLARGNRYKQKLVSINNDGSNPVYEYVDANGNVVTNPNEVTADGTEEIHTYEQKVWHTIEFPQTGDDATEISRKQATFNGEATDNADVKGDGTVYMFRNDSNVPDIGGYDVDADGNYEPADGDQPSIREFLQDPNGDGNTSDAYVDSNGDVISSKLKPDQRIVAFEIGQDNNLLPDGTTANPGFDLQDSMFIITSDAFKSP
ncbi:PilW family protein [Pleurocapsa sp. PCC 7319]|uniref:PilW family protein n=1 Tax=Pleurocapsa sp. PCC 7319 TaxID=118161 RepID=UPI000344ADEA|nr:type II secretion system protein [Pleurocapsa sp. PCC 7319]